VVEDNNLLLLIERTSICLIIDKYFDLIRYEDSSWLKELENVNVDQSTLSLKQKAVLYDILGVANKKEKYYAIALESYADYITSLINTAKNSTKNNYIDEILASFIRCYIYRNVNKKTWHQTINTLYTYIESYRYNEDILLRDITACLLLLLEDKQFQDMWKKALSIYHDLLAKADDYNLLGWIFDKNNYHLPFYTGDLFNTHGDKNNLKNIISGTQKRIHDSGKLSSLKALARDSFLDQYGKLYSTNNGFCIDIPSWISNILTDNDKNLLKNYYKSMPPCYSETEQLSICHDKISINTLEQIKKVNSLEEAIQLIISMNTDGFIAENMNIMEHLTGPGMLISQPIKSVTGEVEYNNVQSIRHQKLNALYNKLFDSIPKKLLCIESVQDLVKKWTIIKNEFHQNIIWYLSSILNADVAAWQRKANINQLVLLLEQILLSLNPNEYKKFVNKKGVAELKGEEFERLVKKLTKDRSHEQDFLLGAFRDHRNKIAHGNTYKEFGNCFMTLVEIVKVLRLQRLDFNLPSE